MMRAPILLLALAGLCACTGGTSKKPPIHLVHDMDFQPKHRAQSRSEFEGWRDGRAMRSPVPGTLPWRHQRDVALEVYQSPDGTFAANPLPVSLAVLEAGRKSYDIRCAPCHDRTGSGTGLVGRRWPVKVPSFLTDERVSKLPDGEIFGVITNGKGTMPSYAAQSSPEERWQIIHYIRALQKRAQ